MNICLTLQNDNADDVIEKPEIISPATNPEAKANWQEMKANQAKERKRLNALKKTESEIASLEERNAFLEEEMTKEEIYTSVSKCMEIHKEQTEINNRLEELYALWESLEENPENN